MKHQNQAHRGPAPEPPSSMTQTHPTTTIREIHPMIRPDPKTSTTHPTQSHSSREKAQMMNGSLMTTMREPITRRSHSHHWYQTRKLMLSMMPHSTIPTPSENESLEVLTSPMMTTHNRHHRNPNHTHTQHHTWCPTIHIYQHDRLNWNSQTHTRHGLNNQRPCSSYSSSHILPRRHNSPTPNNQRQNCKTESWYWKWILRHHSHNLIRPHTTSWRRQTLPNTPTNMNHKYSPWTNNSGDSTSNKE